MVAKNWPDGVVCERCDNTFTPRGIANHRAACTGETRRRRTLRLVPPPKPAPEPVDCEQCGRTLSSAQGLSLHRHRAHGPAKSAADPVVVEVRALAVACGWVVTDDTECVLAVSAADPMMVLHLRTDGTGRVVSRASSGVQFGTVDVGAPIAVALELRSIDDVRIVLESRR